MDKNYDRYFKITEGNSVKVHSCGILLFRKLDEEPEFLILTKPNNNKKNIGLPKGHLETGETIIGAAKRELFEETGIKEEDYKMNDDFLFEDVILPSKHQEAEIKFEKKISIFLAFLKNCNLEINCKEHNFQWIKWSNRKLYFDGFGFIPSLLKKVEDFNYSANYFKN